VAKNVGRSPIQSESLGQPHAPPAGGHGYQQHAGRADPSACPRRGEEWSWPAALSLALMSLGLYSFGMVANDIVDVNRDRYLAPHRPLVTGQVGIQQAHILAAALLVIGCGAGFAYGVLFGGGFKSLFFLAWTVLLIFFYNGAGKFVGAVGILTLGLIRFFQAAVPQPSLHVIWHPLLLMDHVVILSAICYWLEGKRPRLSKAHRWGMFIGLLALNVLLPAGIVLAHWWRHGWENMLETMSISNALLYPLTALVIFVAFAAAMLLSVNSISDKSRRERADFQRRTGRRLMVFGLLWLVLYDIAFAYGYLREL
jgi:4-hydroxybenzoate polyprenyltransferase